MLMPTTSQSPRLSFNASDSTADNDASELQNSGSRYYVAWIDPGDELTFINRMKSLRERIWLQIWMASDEFREFLYSNGVDGSTNNAVLSFLDNLNQLIDLHELIILKVATDPKAWSACARLLILHAQFQENLKRSNDFFEEFSDEYADISCFFEQSQWDFVRHRVQAYLEQANEKLDESRQDLIKHLKSVMHDIEIQRDMYKEFSEVLILESRIVSSKLDSTPCPPLLQGGRRLLKHSDVWRINKSGKKIPSYLMLFNDILVLLDVDKKSPNDLHFKKFFKLESCTVEPKHMTLKFQFDLVFRSPDESFVLCLKNQDERDDWFQSLQNTISAASQIEEFVLKAPVWVPDHMVKSCNACKIKFGLMNRKHHCSYCGYVICSNCSISRRASERSSCKARICHNCEIALVSTSDEKFCAAHEEISNSLHDSETSDSDSKKDLDLSENDQMDATITGRKSIEIIEIEDNVPDLPEIDYLNCSVVESLQHNETQSDTSTVNRRKSIAQSLAMVREISSLLDQASIQYTSSSSDKIEFIQVWLESESEFCANLRIIHDVFLVPIRLYYGGNHERLRSLSSSADGKNFWDVSFVSKQKVSAKQLPFNRNFWDLIEQILIFHSCIQSYLEEDESADPSIAIVVFLPLMRTFYSQLLVLSSQLQNSEGKFEFSDELSKFICFLANNHRCQGRDIGWFLSLVIERVSQYHLLSAGTTHCCWKTLFHNHLRLIETSISSANERLAQENQMVILARRYKNPDILKFGRLLLLDGVVSLESEVGGLSQKKTPVEKIFLYLFSDALLICNLSHVLRNRAIRELIELRNESSRCIPTLSRTDTGLPLLCIEMIESDVVYKIWPSPSQEMELWLQAFQYVAFHE